jgi:hypothetical protein
MESAHLLDVEAGFVVLQAMTWETADTLALVKEYLWKPCEPRQTGRTEAETPNNAVLKAARKSSSEHKMRLTAIVDGLKLDLHCQANGSAVVAAAIKSTGNSTSTTTGAEHTHAVVAAMARQREDIQMLLATGNLASIKPLIDGKDVLMVVLQPVGQPATAILTNVRVWKGALHTDLNCLYGMATKDADAVIRSGKPAVMLRLTNSEGACTIKHDDVMFTHKDTLGVVLKTRTRAYEAITELAQAFVLPPSLPDQKGGGL